MRELEKITINGVRYIVWNEAHGICPEISGIKLLLSARDGVGADVLLVLPNDQPLAIRAFTKDGHEIPVSDEARRIASITLKKSAAPFSKTDFFQIKSLIDYVEVRLTDSFCTRLFDMERKTRLAG